MRNKLYYLIIALVLVFALLVILNYDADWFGFRSDELEPAVTDNAETEEELDDVVDGETVRVEDTELVSAEEEARQTTRLNLSESYEMEVMPDQAEIILAVEIRGEELDMAYDESNQITGEVMTALEELDLMELETLEYRVSYYDDEYRVTNRIRVKLDNIDRVAEVIDVAVNSGANRINNINYSLADTSEVQKEVTARAVESLRNKAERIIGEFDGEDYEFVNLQVNENSDGYYRPFRSEVMMSDAASSMPAIEPGMISISTNIQAEIEFFND
ncbi:MAG: SIMPL domain-containing protein [Halarsenatibacteraceae bacterium]